MQHVTNSSHPETGIQVPGSTFLFSWCEKPQLLIAATQIHPIPKSTVQSSGTTLFHTVGVEPATSGAVFSSLGVEWTLCLLPYCVSRPTGLPVHQHASLCSGHCLLPPRFQPPSRQVPDPDRSACDAVQSAARCGRPFSTPTCPPLSATQKHKAACFW